MIDDPDIESPAGLPPRWPGPDGLAARLQELSAAAPKLADLQSGTALLRAEVAAGWGQAAADEPDLELEPAYVLGELDQIGAAQTLERARYYVDRLIKALLEPRFSPHNDFNLNRWKAYDDVLTDSLWVINRRDSSGVHTAGYWGNFIPQIPNQMIRRYTKRGEWVIDTFAGSGTTLIEGQRLGRHVLGVELQQAVAERARELIAAEPNRHGVVAEIADGDSAAVDYRALLERHGRRSAQLVIAHPPYFDIIKFSQQPGDLSNAASVDEFLAMLRRVIENAAAVLDSGRYLVLVIGDKYARGEWIPLGFQAMNEVLGLGFTLKSIVVKNVDGTAAKRTSQELWRYRALVGGFYIFKHEYIFIFQKRGATPPPAAPR
ncbi:MAG TPA: DNA methyltransferase [Herpetosiphonaceae bacterium]